MNGISIKLFRKESLHLLSHRAVWILTCLYSKTCPGPTPPLSHLDPPLRCPYNGTGKLITTCFSVLPTVHKVSLAGQRLLSLQRPACRVGPWPAVVYFQSVPIILNLSGWLTMHRLCKQCGFCQTPAVMVNFIRQPDWAKGHLHSW